MSQSSNISAVKAPMAWSEERRDRVIQLWMDGWSGTEIAREVGSTRNAIIGVVHRAGIKRGSVARPPSAHVWTVERQAEANQVLKDSLSYAEAARRLGVHPLTLKNVAYRYGLHRITTRARAQPSDKVRRPKLPKADKPKERLKVIETFVAESVSSPNPKPFMVRQFGECAYPVSGEGADTLSCCNPTSRTYCDGHARIMYLGPPEKNGKHFNVSVKAARRGAVDNYLSTVDVKAKSRPTERQIRLGYAA